MSAYTKGRSETELGITEFLNPDNLGFSGVIKERFSDFNVYEIDKSMNVVRLENQKFPETVEVDENVEYVSLTEFQKSLVSETLFSKVKIFNSDPQAAEDVEIDVTNLDKEGRKEIHQILKKFSKIDSNTLDRDDKKLIVARAKGCMKNKKQQWPRDRPKYLHFTLYKENTETYEAISLLASRCRTDEKHFGFAGTKDRRGRTTQRVSVSMVSAKQILGAARVTQKIEVGKFNYEKNEIKLGDLSGNRFELAIRNIEASRNDIEPIMDYFGGKGFLNYFGTQRFGTTGVPTYLVGKKIISSDFTEVINLILKPRDNENNASFKEARKIWADSGDARKAFEVLKKGRKDRTVEGKLLYGLSKRHKNDQIGALDEIPRQQRLLYCHAYQSFLWNKVVSRRIRKYGMTVLPGDLVLKKRENMEESDGEQVSKEEFIERIEEPENFTIHDVLIPIPGCRVKFPENDCKVWFEELLAEDGLNMDSFISSVKTYNLPGDYRNMVVKPWDVSWDVVSYDDAVEDLIMSDKHAMENGRDIPDKKETDDVDDKKYKALIVNMSLPSSCYATMALREILRVETDKQSMIKLNNYEKSDTEVKDALKRVHENSLVDEHQVPKVLKVQ